MSKKTKTRLICASDDFAAMLESRIIRNSKALKITQKHTGKKFFNSFGEATDYIAKKGDRGLFD